MSLAQLSSILFFTEFSVGHFVFCRRCGVAGGEPVPLRRQAGILWYFLGFLGELARDCLVKLSKLLFLGVVGQQAGWRKLRIMETQPSLAGALTELGNNAYDTEMYFTCEWSHMVLYGLPWSCMVPYGPIWFCIILYGPSWARMVLDGHIWSCMVTYGSAWSPMVMYGHESRMVTYGHV